MKKEKIITKIKALMMKSIDNGATDEEAESAMTLVAQLLKKYDISRDELEEPTYDVMKFRVEHKMPMYAKNMIGGSIGVAFDCKASASRWAITFYGYKDDVMLCCFFYKTIMSQMNKGYREFKKTDDYLEPASWGGKKVIKELCAGFRVGFLKEVAIRLIRMYEKRKEIMRDDNKYALVVTGKVEKAEEFMAQDKNVGSLYDKDQPNLDRQAYNVGQEKGREADIQQGLKSKNK